MFANLFSNNEFDDAVDYLEDCRGDETDRAKCLYVNGALYLRHLQEHRKPHDNDEWIALTELDNILEAATIARADMSTKWLTDVRSCRSSATFANSQKSVKCPPNSRSCRNWCGSTIRRRGG